MVVTQQQERSASLAEPSCHIELVEVEDDDSELESSHTEKKTSPTTRSSDSTGKERVDRLRVLWPPLGPAVASACHWGKEAASQQPLLAVALGITLWPTAVITAVIGAPLVIADGFAQDLYNNFQDTPVIHGVERSAAQLYHSGRLTLLCGKLVGRQSLRLLSRQVKRHGGVGQIAHDVKNMALDRMVHPVETAGMAWDAVVFGAGALRDAFAHFQDKERQATAQELQQ